MNFFRDKSSKNSEINSYRCTNCGCEVKELFKTYSPTIQKLVECQNCGEIADNLIEFENLVIIIDLILLSRNAQRHVIFNTNCKNLYKILMIITLLESYFLWHEGNNGKSFDHIIQDKDQLYLERGFYLSTLQIILCEYIKIMYKIKLNFN